jgi:hypothetical protein
MTVKLRLFLLHGGSFLFQWAEPSGALSTHREFQGQGYRKVRRKATVSLRYTYGYSCSVVGKSSPVGDCSACYTRARRQVENAKKNRFQAARTARQRRGRRRRGGDETGEKLHWT